MFESKLDVAFYALGAITILVQLYVIGIALKVSPKEMRNYRWFICASTTFELCFTVVFVFGLDPRDMFPFCIGGEIRGFFVLFGLDGGRIGVALGQVCVFLMFNSLEYSMVYRWAIIQRRFPMLDKKLVSRRWVAIYAFLNVCGAIGNAFIVYSLIASPEDIHNHMFRNGNRSIEEGNGAENITIAFSSSNNSNNTLLGTCSAQNIPWYRYRRSVIVHLRLDLVDNKYTVVPMALFAASAGFFVAFVAFVTYRIIRLLRKRVDDFSVRTYLLNRQLILLLAAQLASPVVFLLLPAGYILCNMLTIRSVGTLDAQVALLIGACYSLCTALLTIGFVTPYRSFTLGLLTCCWRNWNGAQNQTVASFSTAQNQLPPQNGADDFMSVLGVVDSSALTVAVAESNYNNRIVPEPIPTLSAAIAGQQMEVGWRGRAVASTVLADQEQMQRQLGLPELPGAVPLPLLPPPPHSSQNDDSQRDPGNNQDEETAF